jgi:hypothetical protein
MRSWVPNPIQLDGTPAPAGHRLSDKEMERIATELRLQRYRNSGSTSTAPICPIKILSLL